MSQTSPQGADSYKDNPFMEKFSAVVMAAVPQGKALAWLAGTLLVVFLAGYGSALRFSQFRDLPATLMRIDSTHTARMDSLQQSINRVRTMADANTASIGTTRQEIQAASRAQQRILCLVEIAVEGEQLSPFEYNRRCPSAPNGGR